MTHPPRASTDVLLRLLADSDRRRLVSRLAETDDPTSTAQLLDTTSSAEQSMTRRERMIRLHHLHLPALRDADVVAYDSRDGPIERGSAFDVAVSLLRAFRETLESEC